MSASTDAVSWTCSRCAVRARWMEGAEGKHPGIPTDWSEDASGLHCLACRRVLAGEAAAMGEQAAEATREQRLQLRKVGTLEFEIRRSPERPDRVIARACHTSAPAVSKVRQRLAE